MTAIALVVSLGIVPAMAADAVSFTDIGGHWGGEVIEKWAEHGLVQGYGDGSFRPDGSITRGELAAVLSRLMRYQSAAENTYGDLRSDAWYAEAILQATQAGVIQGDGQSARAEARITREEVMVIMARILNLGQVDDAPIYADEGDISPWARDAVGAMTAKGYVEGSNGKVNPKDDIKRIEVLKMLDNAFAKLYDTEGVYSADIDGNAIVNVPGVELKDMTITGDLFVAQGVGDGDFTLRNVKLGGNLIVRGGGVDSIYIIGGSVVSGNVSIERIDGQVRVVVDGAEVEAIYVDDGKDDIIIEGDIASLVVTAPDVNVTIKGDVANVVIEDTASGVTLDVPAGSTVGKIETAADDVTIDGDGKVTAVEVTGGEGVSVQTSNTTVTVGEDAGAVDAGGKTLESGEEGKTPGSSSPIAPPPAPAPASSVTLAEGSVGTAGNGKVTGLTANGFYTVVSGSTLSYVAADGTLSAAIADLAPLTGTEITGLVNNTTYKVQKAVEVTNPPSGGLTLIPHFDGVAPADLADTESVSIVGGTLTIDKTIWSNEQWGILLDKACLGTADNKLIAYARTYSTTAAYTAPGAGNVLGLYCVDMGTGDNTYYDYLNGNPETELTALPGGPYLYYYDSATNTANGGNPIYPTYADDAVLMYLGEAAHTSYRFFVYESGLVKVLKIVVTEDAATPTPDAPSTAFTATVNLTIDGVAANATSVKYGVTTADTEMTAGAAGTYTANDVAAGTYKIFVNDVDTGMTFNSAAAVTVNMFKVTYDANATGSAAGAITAKYKTGGAAIANNALVMSGTVVTFTVATTAGDTIVWGGGASGTTADVDVTYSAAKAKVTCALTPAAPTAVILDDGSVGTAGDSKVTGLTAEGFYTVVTGGVTKFVKADGTLGATIADLAPLTGTEVTGLTNGETYKVLKAAPVTGNVIAIPHLNANGTAAPSVSPGNTAVGADGTLTIGTATPDNAQWGIVMDKSILGASNEIVAYARTYAASSNDYSAPAAGQVLGLFCVELAPNPQQYYDYLNGDAATKLDSIPSLPTLYYYDSATNAVNSGNTAIYPTYADDAVLMYLGETAHTSWRFFVYADGSVQFLKVVVTADAATPTPDALTAAKTAKCAAIDASVEALTDTDYTTASWEAVTTAISTAKSAVGALDNVSAVESYDLTAVNNAIAALVSAEASIGTTRYTFAGALAAVTDSTATTITLLDDITLTAEIAIAADRDLAFTAAEEITITAAASRHFNVTGGTVSLTFDNVVLDGDSAGGGIQATSATSFALDGAVIQDCLGAYTNYGANLGGGGLAWESNGLITITNSEIKNNATAGWYGGGVLLLSTSAGGNATITDTEICGNITTNGSGGGLGNYGVTTIINGGKINGNQARVDTSGSWDTNASPWPGCGGGIINVANGVLTVGGATETISADDGFAADTRTQVIGNRADVQGGGIKSAPVGGENTSVTVKYARVEDNEVNDRLIHRVSGTGATDIGAITAELTPGVAYLNNTGGGIYVLASELIVTQYARIAGNIVHNHGEWVDTEDGDTVKGTPGVVSDGGGIYISVEAPASPAKFTISEIADVSGNIATRGFDILVNALTDMSGASGVTYLVQDESGELDIVFIEYIDEDQRFTWLYPGATVTPIGP